jgi:hypothetical protein
MAGQSFALRGEVVSGPAAIPAAWMGITGVMSDAPHLALLEEVNRCKVAHDDLAAVKLLWQSLNHEAHKRLLFLNERARERRLQATADARERTDILSKFPAKPRKRKP